MSLIEEALKRQQQESSGGGTAAPPTRAAHLRPLSPPEPPTVEPPEAEKKEASRTLPTVAVVLAVLVVILCAGLFLVYSAFRQWGGMTGEGAVTAPPEAPAVSVSPVEQAAPAPAPTAERGHEQGQEQPTQGPEAARPEPGPERAQGQAAVPAHDDTRAGAVPTAPGPVASASEPDAEKASEKVEPPRPAREPVVWPKVAVSGIVQNPRYASAQINGKIVGVGESADGVTLVSVENQGAWLEFRGDRKFFKVRAAQ